jgi:hypothetical protein
MPEADRPACLVARMALGFGRETSMTCPSGQPVVARPCGVHNVTALPRPATTVALCGAQLATARPRVPGGAATAPYAANPAACEPIATVCVTRRLVSYDAAFSGRAHRLLDELRRNSARLSSQSCTLIISVCPVEVSTRKGDRCTRCTPCAQASWHPRSLKVHLENIPRIASIRQNGE